MARNLKTKAIPLAALQVGALFLLAFGASAAPPQGLQSRLQSQLQQPVPHFQAPAQHLDLRAPSHAMDAGNVAERSPNTFPSMSHRQNPAQEQLESPTLGSDGMRSRASIQDFVHKVHREGLPVARLFETKSALLHLGLSPRGKPGLWLVQKTR
jgi:hypothetical protein